MRASKNVLMLSRESGNFGFKNILNNNYNDNNSPNNNNNNQQKFQIKRSGTTASVYSHNTNISRPQNSNLYREIASREQYRRSPRNYSQANIQTQGFNEQDQQQQQYNNNDMLSESKDFNTYSEVQSMLKGLFANLNEASEKLQNDGNNYLQQHKNNKKSLFDNNIDIKTEYNVSEFTNPKVADYGRFAQKDNQAQMANINSGLNVSNLRKSQTLNNNNIQSQSRLLPYNQNYSNSILYPNDSYKQQIEEKDAQVQLLQDTNTELNNQLNLLSSRLDDLMLKVKQKQLQDEKNLQKLGDCGHEIQIERFQKQLQQREEDIKKCRDRMDQQNRLKEREIKNTLDKIQLSKKELVAIQKKYQMTESEKIVDLDQKIQGIDQKNKDLQKEIKQLKKMQHDQGNELVGLQNSDEYPEKIRSLMEEVRWAKDKQVELLEKVINEEKLVKRQKEHLLNLEDSKQDLEMKYKRQIMKLGVAEDQLNQNFDYKDIDQVQLLNKIIALEEQLQARNKEHKLFTMKIKELASQKQQQQQLNSSIIMKPSPRRQARSATRNYKSSHSTSRQNNTSVIVKHEKPFTLQNQTIDETIQTLQKKKELNEQYSFLLGKLDRSRSNIKTNRIKSGNKLTQINNSNLLLPKMHLKNNFNNSRNLTNNNRSIIGSGINQYYTNQNSITVTDTPKINIISPDNKINASFSHQSNNNLRNNNSKSQLKMLNNQSNSSSPYKSVRSSNSKASLGGASKQTLHNNNSNIKSNQSLSIDSRNSKLKLIKSIKKVEFADSINDRSMDTIIKNQTQNINYQNSNSQLQAYDILNTNNSNLTNTNPGMINYGTNKSIRRIKDNNDDLVNLPDFKINLDNNTDDILSQLKNNLTSLI